MAQILIRNIDDRDLRRLKARAREHGRSLQSEAKDILVHAARTPSVADRVRVIEKWQKHFAGRRFSDSTELIREDRER